MLEAVRAGTPLTDKEKAVHDKGLVSILQQIHEDLDLAVLEAYGWTDLNTFYAGAYVPGTNICREEFEQAILTRLVALNHERAAEEKRGLIRWLRPDYQNPAKSSDGHRPPLQGTLAGTETQKLPKPDKSSVVLTWPATLSAQVTAIQKLIPARGQDAETLAARFGKKAAKRTQQIAEIVETLKAIGQL